MWNVECADLAASLESRVQRLEMATELWAVLREEATSAAAQEPMLIRTMEHGLLEHRGFADALAHRLADKLADADVGVACLAPMLSGAMEADPAIVAAAADDLTATRDRDPACPDLLTPFLYFRGFHALQAHRVSHQLWQDGRQYLARYLQSRMADVFGIDIHPAARMGRRIMLDHGTGIVIGETAVVGDDVSILQEVTLGGTGKESGDRHPKIRNGVLIGAGAKILGNIEVGEGAKVGAGSIVLHEVPPYTTVVGNPARAVGPRNTCLPALTMDQMVP
jgi:serine O-acetyltransferase